ncbi:MAG: hypothetical protein JXM72_12785 [Deltaproteobacteria bacterium]|nr:hypothetical protein [Deltaproteobacteria bacterium]
MGKKLGSGARFIGSFQSEVWHDGEYTSSIPDLKQELCFETGRGFFLRQTWPENYPGCKETIQEVLWHEIPDILSVIEGIPEIPRYQLHELLNFTLAGYTQEEISGFIGIPIEKVRNRFVILQRVLKGRPTLQ